MSDAGSRGERRRGTAARRRYGRARAASATLALLFPAVFACSGGSTSPGSGDASTAEASAGDGGAGDAEGSAGDGDANEASDGAPAGDAGDGASSDAPAVIPYEGSLPTAATTALLRVANWSPDAPAIDVCFGAHGTGAFAGPIVAMLGDDAGAALAFPLVSTYVSMSPGTYDVRVVVSGAEDCSVGIGSDTALPPLAVGAAYTVALLGEASPQGNDPALRVTVFQDDLSAPNVSVRFIAAAPAITDVDFGTGATTFVKLFEGVSFGTASSAATAVISSSSASSSSTASSSSASPSDAGVSHAEATAPPPTVDANGYRNLATLQDQTIDAFASGAETAAASAAGVTALSGAVLTIALVGGTSGGLAPELVECVDNGAGDGTAPCFVLP